MAFSGRWKESEEPTENLEENTNNNLSSWANQGPWRFETALLPITPLCHPKIDIELTINIFLDSSLTKKMSEALGLFSGWRYRGFYRNWWHHQFCSKNILVKNLIISARRFRLHQRWSFKQQNDAKYTGTSKYRNGCSTENECFAKRSVKRKSNVHKHKNINECEMFSMKNCLRALYKCPLSFLNITGRDSVLLFCSGKILNTRYFFNIKIFLLKTFARKARISNFVSGQLKWWFKEYHMMQTFFFRHLHTFL